MTFEIPLFDLNFDRNEEEAVRAAVRSRWISMGQRVQQFEERFAKRLGVEHAVAVSSGTAALHLTMLGLDLGPGDEVIVPSLTFVATANAIRYVGASPVFADVTGPHQPTIDPEEVRHLITPRTRAVLPVHYAGFPCPMVELCDLAARHGLVVIEDAAHAPDVPYRGRKLGTWGRVGCFSFFSNKVMTSAEGGLIATNDAGLVSRARMLRSHGMTALSFDRAKGHASDYDVVGLGYNYRLDDIRAALALAQLDKLEASLGQRGVVRQWYTDRLLGVPDLVLPFEASGDPGASYILPIVLNRGGEERRDRVRARLAEEGIQTSVHYPAIHRFSIYQDHQTRLPHTEHIASHEITLPMFDALKEEQVDRIVASLRVALEETAG